MNKSADDWFGRAIGRFASPLFFVLIIFFFTVFWRADYLGSLSLVGQQWLTGSSVKFVDNWIIDGVINSSFLMLERPLSIEDQTFDSRNPYISYPPGTILLPYLIKVIFPSLPTLMIVEWLNMLIQLMIGLFLFAIIFFLHTDSDNKNVSVLLGFSAASTYLLIPDLVYWHTKVFFADQMVLIYFAAILFCEMRIRDFCISPSRLLILLQSSLLFLASLTDYLAWTLALSLFVTRLVFPIYATQFSRILLFTSLSIGVPSFLAVLLFAIQIDSVGMLPALYEKFLFRTGVASGSMNYFPGFAQTMIRHGGWILFALTSTGAVLSTVWAYRKRTTRWIVTVASFLATIMQVLLLRNHSAWHEFSVMKMYIPVILFVTFLIYDFLKYSRFRIARNLVVERVWRLSGCYVLILMMIFAYQIDAKFPKDIAYNDVARDIRVNFDFSDILVSIGGVVIDENPPQLLSLSRKIVHQATLENLALIYRQLIGKSPEANFYVIISEKNNCGEEIMKMAEGHLGTEHYYLHLSDNRIHSIVNQCRPFDYFYRK